MCDKTSIRKKTICYWDDELGTPDDRKKHRLYPYIKCLLPEEIKCAKARGAWPGDDKNCDLLVLMLGFSPEPLLQTVVAYQPKEVLLVVNKKYGEGGDKDGVTFFESQFKDALIEYLPEPDIGLITNAPKILPESLANAQAADLVEDNPMAVFQFLRQHLLPEIQVNGRRNNKRVLIDITGAKKSMIVGAYLFATFANVPITYVDFDEYDEKQGKPYGYTCNIAEIDNPAEKFRLSDWARVEQLYCSHSFRAARDLLGNLKQSLAAWSAQQVFKVEIEAISKLQQVLAVYQLWEDGDYCEAYRKYAEENLAGVMRLPKAVAELGQDGGWPSSALTEVKLREAIKKLEGNVDLAGSIYLNTACIVVYARDELAKIKRLIHLNEDYRSALVRAAGLNEFLIKARLVYLWHSGQLLLCCGASKIKRSELADAAEQKKLDDWLIGATNLPTAISTLKGTKAGTFTFRDKQEGETDVMWRLAADDETQQVCVFWRIKWRDENGQKTSNGDKIKAKATLRNKAAHVFIPLSRTVAKEAAVLAKKNLRDYAEKFAQLNLLAADKADIQAQIWHELCDKCGLTLLPPRVLTSSIAREN